MFEPPCSSVHQVKCVLQLTVPCLELRHRALRYGISNPRKTSPLRSSSQSSQNSGSFSVFNTAISRPHTPLCLRDDDRSCTTTMARAGHQSRLISIRVEIGNRLERFLWLPLHFGIS